MGDAQNPLGLPGPLTQAAIDKARSLPDNKLEAGVGTTDFKSVDLTVGVKKTWRNGWGAGVWLGAKVGAGKPIGSAGVTVSKTFGLLGEVDSMNWLQRNLPSRESRLWAVGTFIGIATFVGANFDAFEAAFGLDPVWEKRIALVSGLLATLIAKQSFSWMPSKVKQAEAIEVHTLKKLDKIDREIDQAIEEQKDDEPPTV